MRDVDGAYLFCGKGSKAESLEIVRDLSLLKLGHCKSIGILKLSSNGVNLLQKWLATGINEGKKNIYYDLIIEEHLRKHAVYIIDVKGYKWFEIDSPQDLDRARSLFK
jgi:choline kinase